MSVIRVGSIGLVGLTRSNLYTLICRRHSAVSTSGSYLLLLGRGRSIRCCVCWGVAGVSVLVSMVGCDVIGRDEMVMDREYHHVHLILPLSQFSSQCVEWIDQVWMRRDYDVVYRLP